MRLRNSFSYFHPAVNFIFFAAVFADLMFFNHPFVFVLGILGSICFLCSLKDLSFVLSSMKYILPLLIFTAVLGPLFNHEGATILWYFTTGNPLTLESVIYGVSSSAMLISVLLWFMCFNEVISSDKFIYLFGRVFPSLSLMLSMALKFVPVFKERFIKTYNARRLMGEGKGIKTMGLVFMGVLGWALEAGADMSDSMRGRGYGLKGRTAFNIYTFEKRDLKLILLIAALELLILLVFFKGGLKFLYYPVIKGNFDFLVFLPVLALFFLPSAVNFKEDRKWD